MTKVKEKMMQWSRYLKNFEKIRNVFIILLLLIVLTTFLLKNQRDIVFLIGQILCIIGAIILSFSAAIKNFKDKSMEFVQKNSFWNIVLSSEEFISSLLIMILISTLVLYGYCKLEGLMTLFIILEVAISIFATDKIAGFFKKRLKE